MKRTRPVVLCAAVVLLAVCLSGCRAYEEGLGAASGAAGGGLDIAFSFEKFGSERPDDPGGELTGPVLSEHDNVLAYWPTVQRGTLGVHQDGVQFRSLETCVSIPYESVVSVSHRCGPGFANWIYIETETRVHTFGFVGEDDVVALDGEIRQRAGLS